MLFRLLVLFVTVPLIELYLLLQVAEMTGVMATFGLVLITGIIGSWLAKREGMMAWQRFHRAIGKGEVPSREIQDGLMIVFAGALLLTPGILTDVVGFFLLLPFGRNLVRRFFVAERFRMSGVQVQTSFHTAHDQPFQTFNDSRTIDGKVASSGRSDEPEN
ncbi:MAG: FxsA family protein [Planctomycetota bacterium]